MDQLQKNASSAFKNFRTYDPGEAGCLVDFDNMVHGKNPDMGGALVLYPDGMITGDIPISKRNYRKTVHNLLQRCECEIQSHKHDSIVHIHPVCPGELKGCVVKYALKES